FGDGTLVNPRAAGVCVVDPEPVLEESNLENNVCDDTVDMVAPDLVVTKTHGFDFDLSLGNDFNWFIDITNVGGAEATFQPGDIILVDDLPQNASYGIPDAEPPVLPVIGPTGTDCSIDGEATLTCTATEELTLLEEGGNTFAIVIFVVRPEDTGAFTNPRSGGACEVDPAGAIAESDEENYDCDPGSINVVAPDLTVSKTNDVGGAGDLDGFTWTITIANVAEGGDPNFDGTADFFNGDVI